MDTQGQSTSPFAINAKDWSWKLWPLFPIYPYGQRRSLLQEVVKDTIWTIDQVQGIFYVVVPIRMTIVRLEAGGLLVYAPVAPTVGCIRLMRDLEAKHGPVKYIILPTASGLEHKVFVGPFARHFPQAQVYVAPSQWSFPLNLPLSWLGFPLGRTQPIPADPKDAPFANEFDYAVLGPIGLGLGKFEEVALFHRRSRTLLVTDSVVSIPNDPPAVVQLDPYPLLFHAKDSADQVVDDTPANRRKGWHRIALFAFFFRPSVLDVVQFGDVLRNAKTASDRSRKGYFGFFPFKWKPNWEASFQALHSGGRLFVAPVLQKLILNRAPQETLDWATSVAGWDFQRIVPCHLDAPVQADWRQFRQAFAFLEKFPLVSDTLPQQDFEFLQELNEGLTRRGITPPEREKV
ncbi:DUF4336 domain-containing protein [Leptolyngbya sp. AN02str]|uniref:DUF4336 domain-containing protein n=1 Tax=Leptolyngbya sp. AN02str TaxID=3423363 RepID=UPI003D317077